MVCKDAVLPKGLLRNGKINIFTSVENTRQPYNNNFCLFRALALHLRGTHRLEEKTSKFFKEFINKMDRFSPNQYQGIHMNDIAVVECLLTLKFMLREKDIVVGKLIG